jgi:hypothetical protein
LSLEHDNGVPNIKCTPNKDLHAFGKNYVVDIHVPFLINRVKKSLGKINGIILSFHCAYKHILSTYASQEMALAPNYHLMKSI